MNYELARELKDAGFPQEVTAQYDASTYHDNTYLPTLRELIEAVLKGRGGLVLHLNVQFESAVAGLEGWYEDGSTPEEAVAKLWLALNPAQKETNHQ